MSNRYTYSVPFTPEQLHADYVVAGLTQYEVAAKWGVSQKVVWRALRRCGIQARKAIKREQRGDRNANWRGGRHVLMPATRQTSYPDSGYVAVLAPKHPHARKNGYVAEHIAVALKAAGLERLPPGHCVHHVNVRKDDNRPTNLTICTHATHQKYHTQLEELAVRLLLQTGRIKFVEGVGYVEDGTP